MSITTLAAALTMVAMLWQPWSAPTVPSHPIGPTDQIPSPMAGINAPTIRFDQTQIDITPGDVFLVNRVPVRLLHRQSIEQTQWIDELNNVRIELTVPKEDYFIVPVKID